ncbi:MAG: DUF2974 domain-containing protein [Faecousia sp.]
MHDDLFAYLKWRGDLPFTDYPPNEVDALIFSALSYIRFDGVVSALPQDWKLLEQVAQELLALPDAQERPRVKQDLELLALAAQCPRFSRIGMSYYQDTFIPEEETQFAAVTFFLPDCTAFLAYRGTDNTLVGWKEDFNMTFQDTIPAQRLALEYLTHFAEGNRTPLRLSGHSKGGNLAVFAAAQCGPELQSRILEVYNQDGPGFTGTMLGSEGYSSIVPKIRTFIPQSSIIGLLLEHEEPHIVIRSREVGVMQHDPYSWDVERDHFVLMEETTEDSKYIDKTLKAWLSGMDKGERNALVDTVFELLSSGGAHRTHELIQPKTIHTILKNLQNDSQARSLIAQELANLLSAAEKPEWLENIHQRLPGSQKNEP